MAMDDPTHVTGLVRAKNVARLTGLAPAAKQPFDRLERRNQPTLIRAV
jgi:hypothetical protein